MSNFLYQIAINSKMQQIEFPKVLAKAEKYGKIHKDAAEIVDEGGCARLYETEPVFVCISEKPEVYAAYYENLFFTYSYDKDSRDRIFRIYIKRPEDTWTLAPKTNGRGFDALNPTNVKAEVYINYNVNVLNVDRCIGESYKTGPWNRTFYQSIKSFLQKIEGYTETKQIETAYEK